MSGYYTPVYNEELLQRRIKRVQTLLAENKEMIATHIAKDLELSNASVTTVLSRMIARKQLKFKYTIKHSKKLYYLP